ncbi:bifunctional YncE family protein/alkaline phosphatase family protein [Actinopolymorpha singaporensis]
MRVLGMLPGALAAPTRLFISDPEPGHQGAVMPARPRARKRRWRGLSAGLLLVIVLGSPAISGDAAADPITALNGSGTASDPYQVANPADLHAAVAAINADTSDTGAAAADYVVTSDIDYQGETFPGINYFTGTFDGRGHTIANLTYGVGSGGPTISGTTYDNTLAFFHVLDKGAVVKNLSLNRVSAVADSSMRAGAAGLAYLVCGGTVTDNSVVHSTIWAEGDGTYRGYAAGLAALVWGRSCAGAAGSGNVSVTDNMVLDTNVDASQTGSAPNGVQASGLVTYLLPPATVADNLVQSVDVGLNGHAPASAWNTAGVVAYPVAAGSAVSKIDNNVVNGLSITYTTAGTTAGQAGAILGGATRYPDAFELTGNLSANLTFSGTPDSNTAGQDGTAATTDPSGHPSLPDLTSQATYRGIGWDFSTPIWAWDATGHRPTLAGVPTLPGVRPPLPRPQLVSSTPAAGETLTHPVAFIVTFDIQAAREWAYYLDGNPIELHDTIGAGLKAGDHTITISATGLDGKPLSWSIPFKSTAIPDLQRVGVQPDGRILTNTNQFLSPYGQRITFPSWSVGQAISPDGSKIAVQTGGYAETAGSSLNIVDAATGKILQAVKTPNRGIARPLYSPDGKDLYAATSTVFAARAGTTSIVKYAIGPDGMISNPTAPTTIALGQLEFPYGMAISADGSKLYTILNGSNSLGVIDTATDQVVDRVRVGQIPQDVAIVGHEAFVTNRGGRVPTDKDTTNLSGTGAAVGAPGLQTPVVADQATGATATGTVSVVDLGTNTVTDTIKVGLQPATVAVHNGELFVTNTNSDTISIIDASTHRVAQTFNVNPLPGSKIGAAPNSVTFTDDRHLLVSVGRDNAIAEFAYDGPHSPVRYMGLIPTDWYPNQINYDAKTGKVIVSNQHGTGDPLRAPKVFAQQGSTSMFDPPSDVKLSSLTHQVFENNGWTDLPASDHADGNQGSLTNGQSPAIPTGLGKPSAIEHVILIIKENEPYDAIFGDLGRGNGDPTKTLYGAASTPNHRGIANTFGLFDNFYDSSQVTGDGHSWMAEANNNDYVEQNLAAGDARGAPQSAGDAMAYQTNGFLWSAAMKAGKTVATYGEYAAKTTGTLGTWQQYYADSQIMEGKATGDLPVSPKQAQATTEWPALNQTLNPDYPALNQGVPEQYRVDTWEKDFKKAEQTGDMPNLTIMTMGNDHTGGPPTAQAQVADNDLAVGRVVDDVSHSRFWKNSLIMTVEDDTQNATDHVDPHRGPLLIASPYAKRGVVNSTYYSQINVVKTIEQILGTQPLNQMDRAATPMYDAFTDKPNFTPYNAITPETPLTQGVTGLIPLPPSAKTAAHPKEVAALKVTAGPPAPTPPADEKAVAAKWNTWYKRVAEPALTGPKAKIDLVNPPLLDRFDWYQTKGWRTPYPGDSRILAPDEVPGRDAVIPFDQLGFR